MVQPLDGFPSIVNAYSESALKSSFYNFISGRKRREEIEKYEKPKRKKNGKQQKHTR